MQFWTNNVRVAEQKVAILNVSPPYDFAWNVQGAARPCAAEIRADICIRCTRGTWDLLPTTT